MPAIAQANVGMTWLLVARQKKKIALTSCEFRKKL